MSRTVSMRRRARPARGLPHVIALAAALCASCSETSLPPAPRVPFETPQAPAPVPPAPVPPAPSPPSSPAFIVSGTVYEHDAAGVRPAASVPLHLRNGAVILEGLSDAHGRYAIAGVRPSFLTITPGASSGYRAPCPAGTDTLNRDMTIDVHIVSIAQLSTLGTPETLPVGATSISGYIHENTTVGRRPVPGAIVDMISLQYRTVITTTFSSAAGHYLLCPEIPGVGTDILVGIQAHKDSYLSAQRPAMLGWDFDGIDITLTRR